VVLIASLPMLITFFNIGSLFYYGTTLIDYICLPWVQY